ncbi:HWE histidine kinase domain-containing protein [Rhodoplanes sp. TEM]|uniref:Blue-light-activated histidine kinase n=1 Tax=Rhodoplanes tepidamans TaxID=200616 RepID=A0ABT5J6Z8_RHOTP|nr:MULTISPECIES: HWE histidine kinase domain-containing protein [Rhodoplanes]MDC7785399.1 HWE histidine kinase domain-containing protein [Rhodoplanes tepidamans]MDC7984358.1 HWE histidine kinase domain-containing protein [Rhodoplanes sp. TEM]MDQ0353148.1 PAS domain S-box-containing protein [Rhodoplanes tepidamans]
MSARVFGRKASARRFQGLLQRPVPLRVALSLLALAALLPSLAFFAVEYRVVVAEKQAEVERQGRLYARAIAEDITREIAVKKAQLAVLATSPFLATDNLAGFHAQARQSVAAVPGWIVLLGADGRQILNTLEPFGRVLPPSRAPELVHRVVETGACATTDLFRSVLADRYVVTLLCPVPDTDYVLSGSLPIEHLAGVMARQTPGGWLATLVDREGVVIARGDAAGGVSGTRLPAALRGRLAGEANGWTGAAMDGGDLQVGWQRLGNEWTVLAAVPRATVDAPMRRWKTDVLWSLIVFSVLAVSCSALVGEWIIRSTRELSRAAAVIGAGGVIDTVETGIREVNEVGQALAQASHDRAKGEIANAHLAALVSSSGDAIMSVSLDGEILSWNAAAEELYGYRAEEAVCHPHAMLLPADRMGELDDKLAAAIAGQSLRLETIRLRRDGTPVEVSLDAAPIRGADGTLVGISVIAHDITRRKRNEAHIQFVMRELSHRTKNLITVIIAMARRTARQSDDFSDFEAKFTGRLHGLARSHDLLVHTDWRGAGLEELVRFQLAPFVGEAASLQVDGPPLLLRPEAVQNLGFALHELATNANKYGALGQAGGIVRIGWSVTAGTDGTERVRLVWHESGGPPVAPPTRVGFGSTVIQKLTEASLAAVVTVAYDPAGFRWEADMPAAEILCDTGSPPGPQPAEPSPSATPEAAAATPAAAPAEAGAIARAG